MKFTFQSGMWCQKTNWMIMLTCSNLWIYSKRGNSLKNLRDSRKSNTPKRKMNWVTWSTCQNKPCKMGSSLVHSERVKGIKKEKTIHGNFSQKNWKKMAFAYWPSVSQCNSIYQQACILLSTPMQRTQFQCFYHCKFYGNSNLIH